MHDENRGMGSYVFLLLLLVVVLGFGITCIYLLRQIDRNTSHDPKPPLIPYVVPQEASRPPQNKFVIPPPPF